MSGQMGPHSICLPGRFARVIAEERHPGRLVLVAYERPAAPP
jgi:hypothetical protein